MSQPFELQAAGDKFAVIDQWKTRVAPAIDTLRMLAGTTEDEFLQIGSQMQDFYHRSSEITSMANSLVDLVSGDQVHMLIVRLRQIMADMEAYLTSTRTQSSESCTTLEDILVSLDQVSEPLEGFQKMTKALRMLGISTKIESARMGEMGAGFITLAIDVEKLSHLVSEKSSNILHHRQTLSTMIADNLRIVRANELSQEKEVSGVLTSTSASLDELVSVNSRCSSFGVLISSASSEVSDNISEVVSSMQMHDMTRQQVEHIIEALERIHGRLKDVTTDASASDAARKLIVEVGDVCELQSAQLRFASTELCTAVQSIIENLRDVGSKQELMASETISASGVADSTGGSFMENISKGMNTVTAVLASCARSDSEMSETLTRVADTMREVTAFVTDIEEIGTEIDLIALNAQIKAAHTGKEGAALGVLAEAIKRLSVDAITQTDLVSQTLTNINQSTEHLFEEAAQETNALQSSIINMEEELVAILSTLGRMNNDLLNFLSGLNSRVGMLTDDIERALSVIDVHERVARMSDEVVTSLDQIVSGARQLEPASTEFKNNLKHMEERYTMQSERHIHEAIARKRSGIHSKTPVVKIRETASESSSEFGDNVDLF